MLDDYCVIHQRRWNVSDNYCVTCMYNYEAFKKSMPKEWRELCCYDTTKCCPSFKEWQEYAIIESQYDRGEISEAQAKEKSRQFAEKIHAKYEEMASNMQKSATKMQPKSQRQPLFAEFLQTQK